MEPLSAVSLAGTVAQFIQFGCSLVSKSSTIYQTGSQPQESVELDIIARQLSIYCAQVQNGLFCFGEDQGSSIVQLASASKNVADELVVLVAKIRDRKGRTGKWACFRQALKSVIKAEELKSLSERLERLRSQMDNQMLAVIGENSALERIRAENAKESINTTTNLMRQKEILESLHFDTMNDRELNISEAHSETFRWLLHSQTDFVEWLRCSERVFWIAGKPGSGKSTLMKYLLGDQKLHEHLANWTGGKSLCIAKYFFWYRGTQMQRSQQGLLQGLLHTIVEQSPQIARDIIHGRTNAFRTPWTMLELRRAFEKLGKAEIGDAKFCVFIDGLDEYSGDGDPGVLVELLQELAKSPRFKLCLASRPWLQFEDAFGQDPRHYLRLQDLTNPDIENYVRQMLGPARKWFSEQETPLFIDLINEVVEKSQGVFLWVVLVVRSLREGLINGDSTVIPEQRLKAFPADLEPFFEALIQSVDLVYRRVMAKTFLVHLAKGEIQAGLPLILHGFLEEGDEDFWTMPLQDRFSNEKIITLQTRMRRRINGRYKGLLEIRESTDSTSAYLKGDVDFLHRSVKDFLATGSMYAMLVSEAERDFNPRLQMCGLFLAQLKTMPMDKGATLQAIHYIHYSSALNQRRLDDCDYRLLDQVRKTLKARDDTAIEYDHQCICPALYGLASYVHKYLQDNPRGSEWERCSPVLVLLGYYKSHPVSHGAWEDAQLSEYYNDLYGLPFYEDDYLFAIMIFLDAGLDPRKGYGEMSCWEYLARFTTYTNSIKRATSVIKKYLLRLLELCIEHGATFSDLTSGIDGRTWVKEFVSSLTNGYNYYYCSPADLLDILCTHGFDPMQRQEGLDNESLWSLLLKAILSCNRICEYPRGSCSDDSCVNPEAAMETVRLCLDYGADTQDPKLLEIINAGRFTADGEWEIRAMIQELERKRRQDEQQQESKSDRRRKKRKRQKGDGFKRTGTQKRGKKKQKKGKT